MIRARGLLAALALAASAGCATTAGGDDDPRDPLESLNRAVYGINEGFDAAIAKPVATAYRDVVPAPLRTYVRNFFGNISDIFIGANNILQGKVGDGLLDWVRVAVNSSFGVLGINDVATDIGLEKHNEDFGQTFGRWGIGEGAYLVLPLLGSSTVRDGVGTVLDLHFDPVGDVRPIRVRNSAVVLRLTGVRADLLDASRILEEAALDKYVFQRDAYLQRRRSLVYDGQPPREERPRYEEEPPSPPEKKSDADSVNATASAGVVDSMSGRAYWPVVPPNYEAVMTAISESP